jgi:outer membrane receptor protein involved in Fe transport
MARFLLHHEGCDKKVKPRRHAMSRRFRPVPTPLQAALWLALAGSAHAQTVLQEVVVTANRQEQQSFDAPAAIQAVGRDVIGAPGRR